MTSGGYLQSIVDDPKCSAEERVLAQAVLALRIELSSVLDDWNALTRAIGAPTNGTAVGHATRLAAAAKEVEALRVYASALEAENAALHAILEKARGVSYCCICGADYDKGIGHDEDCPVGKWDRGVR